MPPDRLDRFFRPPVVLVVDDEEGIRYALTRLLEERGFEVLAAADGRAALDLLRQNPSRVSLCICDFKMPGLDGIETLAQAHALDPELIRVLLTGYATLEAAIEATNRGLDAFITKPYQVRELRAKLDELLAGRRNAVAARLLGGVGLFARLPPAVLAQIYPALARHRAPRGTVIQDRGEAAQQLTLVRDGEVRLETPGSDGRWRPLLWLGPGEHFGDAELVTGEPSAVRAVASLDSEIETLAQPDFARLSQQHPEIAEAVAQAVTRRLHRMVSAPEQPGLVVACEVPPEHPRAAVALAQALAAEGARPVLLSLTARPEGAAEAAPHRLLARTAVEGVPAYVPAFGAIGEEDVAGVLAVLRRRHRLIVIDAPRGPSAALKAGAQADRVVRWRAFGARLEAVFEGETAERRFRVALPAVQLDAGGPGLRRVARRLLGTTIGLALSAGGGRGIAHIGVIRSFERAGLELDGIAGCSIGACMAGFVAVGSGSEGMEKIFGAFELARRSRPFSEPRWEKPRRIAEDLTGHLRFEDAELPYLCNATDLVSGEEVVFEEGPIAQAIQASMSTPGIFPPLYWNGHVYSDGALVNGLPADLLRDRGFDLVAAVDVLHVGHRWRAPPERAAGVARLVAAMAPDLMQKMGALQVVLRSILLAARHLVVARAVGCDLTIRPQFPKMAALDDFLVAGYPGKLEAGLKAGEDAARDLLARRAALVARFAADP